MNREYKFRGKRVDNGQWIYGHYIRYEHMGVVKHIIVTNWAQVYVNSFDVIGETVGQYTGLHDKNGKEVYKGDIVIYGNKIAVVVWDDDTCSFKLKYKENLYNMWAACEVIGNIHDNPELLKEGTNE